MKIPKLIALDLDGTFFNAESRVSERNARAVAAAREKGIRFAISTGRPYSGLPHEYMKESGIRYAITVNGAAVYRYAGKECIHATCMDPERIIDVLAWIRAHEYVHFDLFINGDGYSDKRLRANLPNMSFTANMMTYIRDTRFEENNIIDFLREKLFPVQKVTVNFPVSPEGMAVRAEVFERLSSDPYLRVVSGGFNNLEFTRYDVNKGAALRTLCDYMGIDIADTMAVGDTENDIDIIDAAGVGVAMGNAMPEVKAHADLVALPNTEDGVGVLIEELLKEM